MSFKQGATVRQILPDPIEGVITGFGVDVEALKVDPLHPIVTALVEYETPEEEEGMGPRVHCVAFPLDQIKLVEKK